MSQVMTMAHFGKVAVLLGGRSAEREVSLNSGAAVLAALKRQGVDAHAFDPAERPLTDLVREGYARAHIALHGRYGEDGTVQGALELFGIPYTGSGVLASALALDKWRTKLVWQALGMATPSARLVDVHTDLTRLVREIGLPMIVKPAREGSTIGLSKVTDAAGLPEAVALATRHDDLVLAERFVAGQELTAAILGRETLPLVRIRPAGGLYDYQAKYLASDTRYDCPTGLPEAEERAIRAQALAVFDAVGCRGWGRADCIVDADGKAWWLEINTSPGMTDHSLVPMAARAAGISFDALCLRVLETSFNPGKAAT